MMAASEGDVSGMWLSASPLVLRATLPIVGISLLCKAITGAGAALAYTACMTLHDGVELVCHEV
jgi:hypothetical protein